MVGELIHLGDSENENNNQVLTLEAHDTDNFD